MEKEYRQEIQISDLQSPSEQIVVLEYWDDGDIVSFNTRLYGPDGPSDEVGVSRGDGSRHLQLGRKIDKIIEGLNKVKMINDG